MEDVKIPTCGRTVHYVPVKDDICAHNGAQKLPAVVVQDWGNLSVNLSVMTMNPDAINVIRYSVCHISEVQKDEDGIPTTNYWQWPEIK